MAGNSGQEPKPEPVVEVKNRIIINYLSNGTVHVNGPLNDKILCFGLLEMAKGVVLAYKGEERRIITPDPPQVPIPRG